MCKPSARGSHKQGPRPGAVSRSVLLFVALLAGCGREPATPSASYPGGPADRRPSILLVTIDTWRSDALGMSGSGRVATPRLDSLAKNGAYIRKVQTSCPLTTPAHATILTGLIPHHHGIRDNLHYRLNPGLETIATILSKAGYRTAAVVSGAPLRRIYGLDRGFVSYDDSGLMTEGEEAFVPSQHAADLTTDRALSLLAGLPPAPTFLWVHYYDPHIPYAPPEPYRSRYAPDPYMGEVAFVDEQMGRLLDGLPHDGGRIWTILVTGDHGEGLGEHGEDTHGVAHYEPTLQVPLILSPRPEGFREPVEHAGLVDVLPTICHLAGVKPPPCDGTDLLMGGVPAGRTLSSESAYPATSFRVNPVLSLRRGDLIWIHHGADEVYDLAADPGEKNDLSATPRGKTLMAALAGDLAAHFGDDPAAEIARRTLEAPPEQLEALKSLGYVGGGPGGGASLRPMDIRIFLKDLRAFNEARERIGRGDGAGAREGLRALLRRYPDATLAWRELGSACVAVPDRAGAEDAFKKALALDPDDAVSALNLGNLRAMAGDAAGAEKYFLRSLAAEEAQAEAHLNLGLLYARYLNRPADAAVHLKRFLDLAPEDREAPGIRALLASLPAPPPPGR